MATGWENLITSSSTNTTTSSTTSSTKSSLSNDDFLQLLLTELEHQDPTDPMDSDKILTQTAQLSSLEASQNTTAALEELSDQLSANTNFSAIGVIGQMASLGSSAITLENKTSNFEIYFPSEIKDGTLTITDTNGKTVKTIDIGDSVAGKSGVIAFNWDGVDNDGTQLADGTYSATVSYTDASGALKTTQAGTYPVESVRYVDGAAYVKLGSYYYAIDEVLEFYDQSLA
ncbi:flagellar hook capping FlgD N-terminal domain-containing protein [Sulfurospirillum deleyianum]|uniref:Basal-body rod modification protein FlgD n=1 Tax=Sulfurospirillum deleyianum (strain ATCC 51133 / DSM 6946 / 5175) TaxID=525898 RepID=D1B5D1_SULD5|nr:flagellar hook capping FlgD N-terminal domain-containing protein [Sulfurospirillum deleyianum]ACZ13301.1 flagellar hook capping protein [Sulfurospirillum deleyianum DSM 6946]